MRVRIDPGPRTGFKEIMLVTEDGTASLDVTITHKGANSYRCNGEVFSAGASKTFSVKITGEGLVNAGQLCMEGDGEYELYITPTSGEVTLTRVFVALPSNGFLAYPDNTELANLWDEYNDEVGTLSVCLYV
eukprot:sb/3475002/